MLTNLFFLTDHGEVIIEMPFRDKIPRTTVEAYWASYVSPLRFLEESPAVVLFDNMVFTHIIRNRIFLLATVREEGSALLSLEVLDMVARTLTAYLKEFTEDTLRENFSVVYQLLQEILDYGYPLTTEVFALEELVLRPTLENKVWSVLDTQGGGRSGNSNAIGVGARQALGYRNVPWRDPGTQHSNGELLLDVVESMDYIMDGDGRVQKASLRGAIEVNCRLSGMPDVQLQLLHTNVLDDVGFHRCVRLNRYVGDRIISFIPPDGKFTLARYTCAPEMVPPSPPPFYVNPQVSFNNTGGRFNCMVGVRGGMGSGGGRGGFGNTEEVQKLIVKLMLPPHTASMSVGSCSAGSTSFERSRGLLTWTVGNLGRNSASLSGEFLFESPAAGASGEGGEKQHGAVAGGSAATAVVSFVIPNYSVSGLRVDTVQILNESGKPYKGVRYSTKAGHFIVRTA